MDGRRRVDVDAAVAAIVGDGQQRQKNRTLSKARRAQVRRDSSRERITLELDPVIAEMLRMVARAEGCSPAGAANRLLQTAIEQYADGELTFNGHRRPSRSPRYEWVVELDLNGLREKLENSCANGGV